MGFWVDWELWAKMCFVLGCLIVVVLIYGTGVQLYNKWRIRKYRAAAKSTTHQRGPSELEAVCDDVPFGSRAIESGIEVEGIWISNHNSPLPSPRLPGTPKSSRPTSSSASESPAFAGLEGKEHKHHLAPPSRRSVSSHSPRPSTASRSPSRDWPLPENLVIPPPRSRQSSSLDLEKIVSGVTAHHPNLHPEQASMRHFTPTGGAISGYESNSPARSMADGDKLSPQRSTSSDTRAVDEQLSEKQPSNPPPTPAEQAQPDIQTEKAKEERQRPRIDLHQLDNHRLSHVAETGQLARKGRFARIPEGGRKSPFRALTAKLKKVASKENV